MYESELQWLLKTSSEMESVVEVGCYKGRSTQALLLGCRGKVYAIDNFVGVPGENEKSDDLFLEFVNNVGHFYNLQVIRNESIIASRFFADKSIDMVFIDGDHSKEAVKEDITAWLPKCKKLICGHDCQPVKPGSVNNVTKGFEVFQALEELNLKYEIAVGSIWTNWRIQCL